MARIIIDIPDNKLAFVLELLKNLGIKKVRTISGDRVRKENKQSEDYINKDTEDEILLISEKSLAEDWLSDEDNRWDEVL